jgi:hypothetical protein
MEYDTNFILRISEELRKMLFDLAADANTTASEWLRTTIRTSWTQKQIDNTQPEPQSITQGE